MGFYLGRRRHEGKGFLLGGTAGRTTLNGEGLQHQDGHSHLAAAATPNIKAYDLAYAYEIAIIVQEGMKEMVEENKDVVYYLTLENENYIHPKKPKGVSKDLIKGLYKIRSTKTPKVRLLGSGPLMGETLAAADLLDKDWGIEPGIWNVTSFSELREDAEEEVDRWNLTHLTSLSGGPIYKNRSAKTKFQRLPYLIMLKWSLNK